MKLNNLISNKIIKIATLIFTTLVSLSLIITNNKVILNFRAIGADGFFEAFLNFRNLGWYDGCAAGYGFLYNGLLSFFFNLTNSLENSFFWVNLFSQILILCILIKTLRHYKNKVDKFYFYSISILTFTQIINLKCYSSAYNDSFLAIFIAAIIYVISTKLLEDFLNKRNFIYLGLLLAIALSIRETTLTIIIATFLVIILLKFTENIAWKIVLKNILYLIVPFLLITVVLHFPSLKENQKLCFYDKNPKTGANWTQRNYLGLKKIQNKELPMHRDAIWKETKFNVVNEYLAVNGNKSLPRNIIQVLLKNPLLLSEIFTYNFIYLVLFSVRFYGILFPFLAFLFIRKPILKTNNVMLFFILFIYVFWSIACFTFVETRWLTGYEFMIPAAFFGIVNHKNINFSKTKINLIVIVSLLLVSLFNLKSILS